METTYIHYDVIRRWFARSLANGIPALSQGLPKNISGTGWNFFWGGGGWMKCSMKKFFSHILGKKLLYMFYFVYADISLKSYSLPPSRSYFWVLYKPLPKYQNYRINTKIMENMKFVENLMHLHVDIATCISTIRGLYSVL